MWCFSSGAAMPRIIMIAFSSLGSSTCTTWKRRVSAGSFSKYFLYSAQVVAAMVRNVPRASAGFSRLAASPVPAAPPAPISVCASSMNRMIGLGEDCTSSITWRSRFSNSPFMLAPACSRPTSSVRRLTSRSIGGTSPWTMRSAKPSTTAVLPTPASPVRIGLFCRRRISTSTTWRISWSRPTIGSSSPLRARSVRSTENCRSASCLPICAGAIAPLASPGAPAPPTLEPSAADSAASGELARILVKSSASASAFTCWNCRLIAYSALRKVGVFRQPNSRWPVRTWNSPNISVANTQPRSTASSICGDRSEIELAPRGSLSSAAVKSAASLAGSSS